MNNRMLPVNKKSLQGMLIFSGVPLMLALVIALGVAQAGPAQNAGGPKTAEQSFKNIQVLKDIPADQLIPSMQFISASLGVECEFCHVQGAFEKDDKKAKATARMMIKMQMAINKDHFEGHLDVTCNSCHRGAHDPVAVPVIGDEEPKPEHAAAPAPAPGNTAAPTGTPAPRPSADAVLEKYVQALGGSEAIQKVSSRVEKGTISFARGQIPIEVFAKAPSQRATVVHQANGDNVTAYDGHAGWLGAPGRPASDMSEQENEAFRLDADFHFATDLKQIFGQFRVGRPEKIGDKPATLVFALRQHQPPVRLYFDDESGLLVRQVRYAETPLGRNPTEIDYSDYRDAGGVKIPYRWTIARPGGRFTIQVSEVQQNVAIDDAKFAKPAAAAPAAAR
jgi:hypothetical protein